MPGPVFLAGFDGYDHDDQRSALDVPGSAPPISRIYSLRCEGTWRYGNRVA
jgi:hypothetical protein